MHDPLDVLLENLSQLDERRAEILAEIRAIREDRRSKDRASREAKMAQSRQLIAAANNEAVTRRALALSLSLDGHTTAQIAERFGISRSRAAQLVSGGRRDLMVKEMRDRPAQIAEQPRQSMTVTYKLPSGHLYVKDADGNLQPAD